MSLFCASLGAVLDGFRVSLEGCDLWIEARLQGKSINFGWRSFSFSAVESLAVASRVNLSRWIIWWMNTKPHWIAKARVRSSVSCIFGSKSAPPKRPEKLVASPILCPEVWWSFCTAWFLEGPKQWFWVPWLWAKKRTWHNLKVGCAKVGFWFWCFFSDALKGMHFQKIQVKAQTMQLFANKKGGLIRFCWVWYLINLDHGGNPAHQLVSQSRLWDFPRSNEYEWLPSHGGGRYPHLHRVLHDQRRVGFQARKLLRWMQVWW